ncbi:unnamed protein product [Microthlaspi erraticum]|uniref:F-box domain-containing protein n=1 Tax=Microthlaspi erraticum TaxID=1685480 RepID=A0A6D2HHR1_9BRAS|nr:unnamed protein product [Microthlaspi erraticum]
MKNMEQQDLLLTTQSSNSVREYTDPIPSDILIDIFSRVPAKSIARFRCVSKLWRSIPSLPGFIELFHTKSLARTRLLFAVKVDKELFLFSSPQPHNPVLESSTLVDTRYNKCFPNYIPSDIRLSLGGLVSLREWESEVWVIYNPLTGERESIALPEVESTGEICINGVLYHGAYVEGSCMIVCFDFSSEKFMSIKLHGEIIHGILINYKGNLGVLVRDDHQIVLWVLEDAGNHIWCKTISVPLSLYDDIRNYLHFVGMTGAGEIVLSPHRATNPFYIVYYNIERNTFTRVYIQGYEELNKDPISTPRIFLDYVENMKLL